MNLYIRFFENEILVTRIEEAFDFLSSIPEVGFDDYLQNDLQKYFESDATYPKRYKVRNRAYFIVIKTNASTLEEFKAAGLAAQEAGARRNDERARLQDALNARAVGWYDVQLLFKRVLSVPDTQKFLYVDTTFGCRVKAISKQDCYNRVIDHLRTRGDVDNRSQFPSIKGKNFSCEFLGMNPA